MRKGWQLEKAAPTPDTPSTNTQKKANVAAPSDSSVVQVVDNCIYLYGNIEWPSVLVLNRELRKLSNTMVADSARIMEVGEKLETGAIFLHIGSYGGSLFAALAGMDAILKCNKRVPVHTVVDGCAASAATLLVIAGAERSMSEDSFMLIHQLSSFMWGKYEEFKDEMRNLDLLMKTLKKIYKRHSKLPEKELDQIMQRDLWFDAATCKRYGLVDKITK